MSDPVSNREIEDVLSSIRRLVSVEKQEAGRDRGQTVTQSRDESEADPQPPGRGQADQDDKLVLTPSFRVAEGAVQKDPGEDSLSLEQWQIHPDAREDGEPGPAEAEAGEASDSHAAQEHDTPDDAHPEAQEATDADPAQAHASEAPDDHTDAGVERELEARIAGMEAAVAAREDEWDPDGDDSDDYFASDAEPLPWEDYTGEDAVGSATHDDHAEHADHSEAEAVDDHDDEPWAAQDADAADD